MISNIQRLFASTELQYPEIPEPIIGGKGIATGDGDFGKFGNFLLQRGPGVLRCIACTHTGSGHLRLFDGVEWPEKRLLFPLSPTVLGHWMLDVGFNHGLILEHWGKMVCFATIVWVPWKQKKTA
jgi:hypothetical protein